MLSITNLYSLNKENVVFFKKIISSDYNRSQAPCVLSTSIQTKIFVCRTCASGDIYVRDTKERGHLSKILLETVSVEDKLDEDSVGCNLGLSLRVAIRGWSLFFFREFSGQIHHEAWLITI